VPALPPVPSVLRLQFIHSIDAIVNAYVHAYYRYSGTAPTTTDLGNLCGAIGGVWVSNCAPVTPIATVLTSVTAIDLSSPTAAEGSSSFSHAGTRTGAPLTANDCALVNLHIGRRYRGGKPRQYWPFGVNTDLANPTQWTTAFQTAVTNAINGQHAGILGLTWPGGSIAAAMNVSYYTGFKVVTDPVTGRARNVPTPRTSPLQDQISAFSCNIKVGTQRRRQRFSA
jgi:hypothetical protein